MKVFSVHVSAVAMAAALLTGGCASMPATAQDTVAIANAIVSNYPASYLNPKIDRGWCFHVEMEKDEQTWRLPDGRAVEAKQAGRIQTIYSDRDGTLNYSSIFLALVGPELTHARELAYTAPSGATSAPPAPAAAPAPPRSGGFAKADCPDGFAHPDDDKNFLKAFVRPLVFDGGTAAAAMPGSTDWVFNGRRHRVFGVTMHPIRLKRRDGTAVGGDNFLLVGYGGGSGP